MAFVVEIGHFHMRNKGNLWHFVTVFKVLRLIFLWPTLLRLTILYLARLTSLDKNGIDNKNDIVAYTDGSQTRRSRKGSRYRVSLGLELERKMAGYEWIFTGIQGGNL